MAPQLKPIVIVSALLTAHIAQRIARLQEISKRLKFMTIYRENAAPEAEKFSALKTIKEYNQKYDFVKLGFALSPALILFWNIPIIPYVILEGLLAIISVATFMFMLCGVLDNPWNDLKDEDFRALCKFIIYTFLCSSFCFFFFLGMASWNIVFYVAITCLVLVLFVSLLMDYFERKNENAST